MRSTAITLLLLALTSTLHVDPAKDEENALAARVAALLESPVKRERAWGAYLASKHGIGDVSPRLTALLREHAGEDGPESDALRRAILDALIRLETPVDTELCRALIAVHPDPILIILSGRGKEAEPVARTLLARESGLHKSTWRAVRMLLAEWRSPHLAADLLTGLTIDANVEVWPKHVIGGSNGGSFPRASLMRELLRKMPRWPPAVRYLLTDLARPGTVLLVPGSYAIGYRRMELARGKGRGFTHFVQGISIHEFRLRCMAHLLRMDIGKHWGLEPALSRRFDYENNERLQREVTDWLTDIRRKHTALVAYLVQSKRLPEESAADIRLELRIRVQEMRPEKDRTKLPEFR